MGEFSEIFQGVEDPRKSNATKHDVTEMLTVALLATLTGKSSCSSFARFAKHKYEFLSEFMELKGGRLETPVRMTTDVSGPSSAVRSIGGGDSRRSPGPRTNAISDRTARSEKLSFNGRRIRIGKAGSRCGDFGLPTDLSAIADDSFDVNGRSFTSVDSAPVDGGSCKGGVHPRHSGASASARQRESLEFHSSDGPNSLEFGGILRSPNQSMIPLAPRQFWPGFPERLRRNDKHKMEHLS